MIKRIINRLLDVFLSKRFRRAVNAWANEKPRYWIVKYLNAFHIEKYSYGLAASSLWNWNDNQKNWTHVLYKNKNRLCAITHDTLEEAEKELKRISTEPEYYYSKIA